MVGVGVLVESLSGGALMFSLTEAQKLHKTFGIQVKTEQFVCEILWKLSICDVEMWLIVFFILFDFFKYIFVTFAAVIYCRLL